MKSTTQSILNILRSETFVSNIKGLLKYLTERNISLDYGEVNLTEIITKLEDIIKFFSSEKNLQIIDFLPKNKRDSLLAYTSNIQSYLQSIQNQQFHVIQELINQVEGMYDILYLHLINSEDRKFTIELEEVRKLKNEYRKALSEIEKLLENKAVLEEFSEDIKKIRVDLDELSTREANIREIENVVEQKRANIEEFSKNIDAYKTKISTGENSIATLIKDHNDKLAAITAEETDIKERAKSLLTLVNEGALGKHFKTKEGEIETEKYLKYFVGSITLGVIAWFCAFNFIDIDNTSHIVLFLLRFLVFLPFIGMAGLFYSEYSFHKYLKENYSFRSILSLSLSSFSDIITQHKDPGTKQFIENSVNQIFESPLSEKGGISKRLSEQVIEKSLEKALNVSEKAANKVLG